MHHLIGIGFILISAAAFGAMPILGKFVYTSGISTHSLLFFRFSIALAVMLPIALVQKRRFPKGRDLYILIAMGAIGYAGQAYCYFKALTFISPSLVVILLYLYPAMVVILAVFFLNERLTIKKLSALVIALSGTALVIGFDINGNLLGILFGIGSALIYSVYNIVGARVMGRNDAFTASIVVIGSAAVFYFFYNLAAGFSFPEQGSHWAGIIGIAILSTGIAIYTYFQGMKLIGAVNTAMLSTFEPVTAMILSAVFFGQVINGTQMTGAALILFSAILVALRPGVEKKSRPLAGRS